MDKRLFISIWFLTMTVFCDYISEETFCELKCFNKINQTSDSHISNCNCSAFSTGTLDLNFIQLLLQPELLCSNEDTLRFKWNAIAQPLKYGLEYKNENFTWKFANKSEHLYAEINKVTPNTEYEVRLWGISSDGRLYGPSNSTLVQTKPIHYQPEPAVELKLLNLTFAEDKYVAKLKWLPANDSSCFYAVLYYPKKYTQMLAKVIYVEVSNSFEVIIPDLLIGMKYNVSVSSINSEKKNESEKAICIFTTKSCIETYKNLIKCAPPPTEDISSKEVITAGQIGTDNVTTYDVTIFWKKPELIPDNYTVTIYLNYTHCVQTVAGNETSALFYNLTINDCYDVTILSASKGGNGSTVLYSKKLNTQTQTLSLTPVLIGTVGGITALTSIILIFIYYQYRYKKAREKLEEKMTVSKFFNKNLKEKYSSTINNSITEYGTLNIVNDEWYLDPEQVIIDTMLGEGAFGVVHKGYIKKSNGNRIEIAIKFLKGNPNGDEIRQFEHEIEIMKSVGSHPHLVSLLGCCSKVDYFSPFLIVEYCAKGDLQTYLRRMWEQLSGESTEMRYVNTPTLIDDPKIENHFFNKVYELFDEPHIESKDLLSFARQIVLGMEYLSNLRVVHRDLATRNVLICEDRTVKIADFGLSRDVYQDNIYMKTGTGKLPIKWMALESLTHLQYTTQSDVWSFGIVLWEIVTLGGNPYSTISTRNLLQLLKTGYRMECPKNCNEELYEIMLMCWKAVPMERPMFSDLRKMLEKLLENDNCYINLDIKY